MTPASMYMCHVVLSVWYRKVNVRQNSTATDAVHISPDDSEYSPCLYELRHSVNVLSLQQPLYVQGLVLC